MATPMPTRSGAAASPRDGRSEEIRCLMTFVRDDRCMDLYMQAECVDPAEAKVSAYEELIENWTGRPQDNRLAMRLLMIAARQNDTDAKTTLQELGLSWETFQVSEHDEFAMQKMNHAHMFPRDKQIMLSAIKEEEGMVLYQKAKTSDSAAKLAFGQLLIDKGLNFQGPLDDLTPVDPKDNDLAIDWIKEAGRLGNAEAKKLLRKMK